MLALRTEARSRHVGVQPALDIQEVRNVIAGSGGIAVVGPAYAAFCLFILACSRLRTSAGWLRALEVWNTSQAGIMKVMKKGKWYTLEDIMKKTRTCRSTTNRSICRLFEQNIVERKVIMGDACKDCQWQYVYTRVKP